jgi:hypothetical protein
VAAAVLNHTALCHSMVACDEGDVPLRTSIMPGQAEACAGLRPRDIEAWQATLRTSGRKDGKGGVSVRTIKHAH